MKKILFFFAFFLGVHAVQAQASKAPLQDLSGVTTSIMSKLSAKLGLTEVQQPKLTTLVTNFLTQKEQILPLQDTNPTAYTKKLASMQHGLFGAFKRILQADQYTALEALKPPANDVTNVLSKLFY
ncbi:hypothetical protein GA0116948_103238 [Chitinophaga costaii]|uniref:DUF2059 domain-containing protein n=1 Tax=Chitinophaga costaii TaxID=1335309 RepID=A0A1C4BSX3_9BACT|nr:hypothetical protein [Chitinophaga costaii]PUZ27489.1 hypothetical protein DCM91_04470 [Chitinophaga costaii]SCC09863.1 hypothetical protein GA0116948_103238 [Chitinophaga costaii]